MFTTARTQQGGSDLLLNSFSNSFAHNILASEGMNAPSVAQMVKTSDYESQDSGFDPFSCFKFSAGYSLALANQVDQLVPLEVKLVPKLWWQSARLGLARQALANLRYNN